jgi:hypothetical protein
MAKQRIQQQPEQPAEDRRPEDQATPPNGRQEAPAPEADEEEVPRMSRHEAALKVVAGVRSETTLAELAQEAARLYHEGRGDDPPDEASVERQLWVVNSVLDDAEALGLIEQEEHWEVRVKPVRK